jgi:hypothetical protein
MRREILVAELAVGAQFEGHEAPPLSGVPLIIAISTHRR